jgi:hypothetical protein
MPATSCTNPVLFDLSRNNGQCQFVVELTWDGTSTPPNCNGVVSRVRWNNTGQKTYYAHLPDTRLGPAVYQIVPGDVGNVVSRSLLHSAGLDDRSDITGVGGLDLNDIPPQAGERLLNP